MPRRTSPREPIKAWLGDEIQLEKGRLTFDGGLQIDGTVVDGRLAGPLLIVGPAARVTGRISVRSLIVYGRVHARAHVAESAVIAPGGHFTGEMVLERPTLTVEDGGVFQGRVRMVAPVSKGPRRAARGED